MTRMIRCLWSENVCLSIPVGVYTKHYTYPLRILRLPDLDSCTKEETGRPSHVFSHVIALPKHVTSPRVMPDWGFT